MQRDNLLIFLKNCGKSINYCSMVVWKWASVGGAGNGLSSLQADWESTILRGMKMILWVREF